MGAVSSIVHNMGRMAWGDLQLVAGWQADSQSAYAMSKLANVLCSNALC